MSQPQPRSPLSQLVTAPGRFDFFQALRMLERSGGVALGGDTLPEQESAQLRVQPGLRFPAGPIARSVPGTGKSAPELWVTFGGLTGPDGILPQHYTAMLLARNRLKDNTLRDWLDLFHHRALSLLMRAWEKNRWPAIEDRQRAERKPDEAAATRAVYSLAGFGTNGLRGRLRVPDDTAVFFAGLLSRQPRTATGLEQVLGEYTGWPISVEQYAGQWLYLDEENKAVLPQPDQPGLNTTLGRDVVIGRRVWDVQGKVRIVVGPLDMNSFYSLLPGGDARRPVSELVRLYLGVELDAEVRLVLAPAEVPWSALNHDEDRGPRLGRNAWVRTHDFGKPVSDATFDIA